jgi:hypothetical protein
MFYQPTSVNQALGGEYFRKSAVGQLKLHVKIVRTSDLSPQFLSID